MPANAKMITNNCGSAYKYTKLKSRHCFSADEEKGDEIKQFLYKSSRKIGKIAFSEGLLQGTCRKKPEKSTSKEIKLKLIRKHRKNCLSISVMDNCVDFWKKNLRMKIYG